MGTGFVKTLHVHNKTEIYFILSSRLYTQELFMDSVFIGQFELLCFFGGHFADHH